MIWKDALLEHSELLLLLVYTWCQLDLSPCGQTSEKCCHVNKSRWRGFPLWRVCWMKCPDGQGARALEPIGRFLSQILFHSGWICCRRGLSIWGWRWDRGRWRVVELAHMIGASRSSLGVQEFEYVGAMFLVIWHLHCSTECQINPRIWVLDIPGACRWPGPWISRTWSSLPNWTLQFFCASSCFKVLLQIFFQSNSDQDTASQSWASHSKPASRKQLPSPASHSSRGWCISNWKYME